AAHAADQAPDTAAQEARQHPALILLRVVTSIQCVDDCGTCGARTASAGLESNTMSEFAAPLPILARYAVMVDVGYIYAAAGELLFGTSSRREYRVDAVSLIQAVTKHADELFRG